MSGEEQWSTGELVRNVKALIESLNRFEEETREAVRRIETGLPEKYVTKELLTARLAPVNEHRDRMSDWLRMLVAPLIVGLVMAAVTAKVASGR